MFINKKYVKVVNRWIKLQWLLVDVQVECPALIKSLPPGYKFWSNAPGLPEGEGGGLGVVMLELTDT